MNFLHLLWLPWLTFSLVMAQPTHGWHPWLTTEVHGTGPDVVFVPGYGSWGEVWDQAVDSLQGEYRCHQLTLRQFRGQAPRDSQLLDGTVEALHTYLREETDGQAIVVGHSIGGFFSLDLAARHPQSLTALVSVDALPYLAAAYSPEPQSLDPRVSARRYAGMDSTALYQTTLATARTMITDSTQAVEVARMCYHADRAAWGRLFAEFYNRDLRDSLARIQVPAQLMVAAGMGEAATLAVWREQYAQLAQQEMAYHPKARHFIMLDDPSWFLARLRSFLEETLAPSAE